MIIADALKNKTILIGQRNTIIAIGGWYIVDFLGGYFKRGWNPFYDNILACFYSLNILQEFICVFVIFFDFAMAVSEKFSCWVCGKRIGIIFILACNIFLIGFFLFGFFSTAPYTILGLSSILYFTAKSHTCMERKT